MSNVMVLFRLYSKENRTFLKKDFWLFTNFARIGPYFHHLRPLSQVRSPFFRFCFYFFRNIVWKLPNYISRSAFLIRLWSVFDLPISHSCYWDTLIGIDFWIIAFSYIFSVMPWKYRHLHKLDYFAWNLKTIGCLNYPV